MTLTEEQLDAASFSDLKFAYLGLQREANALREENEALREERDIAVGLHRLSEADLLALRAALAAQQEALRDANASWSFSDGQAHTHTWHDKADWMERNRAALARITPAPSASRDSEEA